MELCLSLVFFYVVFCVCNDFSPFSLNCFSFRPVFCPDASSARFYERLHRLTVVMALLKALKSHSTLRWSLVHAHQMSSLFSTVVKIKAKILLEIFTFIFIP